MTRPHRLSCTASRALAAALLLPACSWLPTHPFQGGEAPPTEPVEGPDPAGDTAWWEPEDTAWGLAAVGYRGTYQVDVAASTLAGETSSFGEVWANYLGQYQVGDVLCGISWPATQASHPEPATDCDDCAFALMVEHGAFTSKEGDHCDAWYGDEWDDGAEVSRFIQGIGVYDYAYYGPAVMVYYGGRWSATALASFDGTTLDWEVTSGYLPYY
jgi:hypothetical protein